MAGKSSKYWSNQITFLNLKTINSGVKRITQEKFKEL